MFQHQGIWLPDGEKHFPDWMTRNGEIVDGKGTYQIKKLRETLKHCKQFRTAVDVGAHVGLWSMHLAKRFHRVHAFEPVASFRECFVRNIREAPGVGTDTVDLAHCALGAESRRVHMIIDCADTGGTHVGKPAAELDGIQMHPMDRFLYEEVDLIKIDVEGFELEVLKGAVETIKRCRPVIIVEQKPHKLLPNFGIKGAPAVDFLKAMGMVLAREMGGDYIMVWPA